MNKTVPGYAEAYISVYSVLRTESITMTKTYFHPALGHEHQWTGKDRYTRYGVLGSISPLTYPIDKDTPYPRM